MTTSEPRGGTELLLSHLQRYLPELTNQVQFILSRPENYELEAKPRILWLHDLPQDPAAAPLRDPSYRSRFNRIVFVSHWQQQMYNAYLGIPYRDGVVVKNAVPLIEVDWSRKSRDIACGADQQQCDSACRCSHDKKPLRFIYTSTPHRGLAILAAAADALAKERQDWELHVYSSLKLYGWDDADQQFAPLYEALQKNPCVRYHGTQPNSVIREAVQDAHVFVYPSIYQETSCLALIEAMMAGCLSIVTSHGALIETAGEWAWMMQYSENYELLAQMTLDNMRNALRVYDEPYIQSLLRTQANYYRNFYSFESRLPRWETMLKRVITEGAPVEKLIIG